MPTRSRHARGVIAPGDTFGMPEVRGSGCHDALRAARRPAAPPAARRPLPVAATAAGGGGCALGGRCRVHQLHLPAASSGAKPPALRRCDRRRNRLLRQAADAMISSGMAELGYQYVNIDDCWMVKPDSGNAELGPA